MVFVSRRPKAHIAHALLLVCVLCWLGDVCTYLRGGLGRHEVPNETARPPLSGAIPAIPG